MKTKGHNPITIFVSDELREGIRQEAEEKRETTSDTIRRLLASAIKDEGEK